MTIIDPDDSADDPDAIVGRGYEPHVLAEAGVERAAGFVAGTDNDTTNLSLVAAAHRANPKMFVAARQNKPASAPLFAAVDLDALLVPAEVVAHEVYAQLSTPLLWRFLREMPGRGDDWADSVIGRLTNLCGKHLQSLWKVRLSAAEAPALRGIFAQEQLRLGDLLRSPDDREDHLHAVVLIVARGDDVHLAPPDDFTLEPDDELLLVGEPAARRLLDSTLLIDATRELVLHGRHVPSSWIWRRITRRYT